MRNREMFLIKTVDFAQFILHFPYASKHVMQEAQDSTAS